MNYADACEHFGVREWGRCAPLAVRILRGSEPAGECWLRRKPLSTGYSLVSRPGRKPILAHRAMYELMVGPIPGGYDLDHLCHTNDPTCHKGAGCLHRSCVNPAHLEPVTERENTLRGSSIVAQNAAKTHCKRGHEFTPENTYVMKSAARARAGRGCRTCRTEYFRAYRAAQRAAA